MKVAFHDKTNGIVCPNLSGRYGVDIMQQFALDYEYIDAISVTYEVL